MVVKLKLSSSSPMSLMLLVKAIGSNSIPSLFWSILLVLADFSLALLYAEIDIMIFSTLTFDLGPIAIDAL